MSEVFLAGLIDNLIYVLGKEAKKRNIDLLKEAQKQNLEKDLIEYVDLKETEEEGKAVIEVLSPSSEDKTDETTGLSNDDESDVEGKRNDIMKNEKEGKLNELPVDKVSSVQEESPPVLITASPPNKKKVINEPIIEKTSKRVTL